MRKEWLEALRSGEYKQTTGMLRSCEGYCCLGVGAVVCGIDVDLLYSRTILSEPIREMLGLGSPQGFFTKVIDISMFSPETQKAIRINLNSRKDTSLVTLNDSLHATFEQIADFIEKNGDCL